MKNKAKQTGTEAESRVPTGTGIDWDKEFWNDTNAPDNVGKVTSDYRRIAEWAAQIALQQAGRDSKTETRAAWDRLEMTYAGFKDALQVRDGARQVTVEELKGWITNNTVDLQDGEDPYCVVEVEHLLEYIESLIEKREDSERECDECGQPMSKHTIRICPPTATQGGEDE